MGEKVRAAREVQTLGWGQGALLFDLTRSMPQLLSAPSFATFGARGNGQNTLPLAPPLSATSSALSHQQQQSFAPSLASTLTLASPPSPTLLFACASSTSPTLRFQPAYAQQQRRASSAIGYNAHAAQPLPNMSHAFQAMPARPCMTQHPSFELHRQHPGLSSMLAPPVAMSAAPTMGMPLLTSRSSSNLRTGFEQHSLGIGSRRHSTSEGYVYGAPGGGAAGQRERAGQWTEYEEQAEAGKPARDQLQFPERSPWVGVGSTREMGLAVALAEAPVQRVRTPLGDRNDPVGEDDAGAGKDGPASSVPEPIRKKPLSPSKERKRLKDGQGSPDEDTRRRAPKRRCTSPSYEGVLK